MPSQNQDTNQVIARYGSAPPRHASSVHRCSGEVQKEEEEREEGQRLQPGFAPLQQFSQRLQWFRETYGSTARSMQPPKRLPPVPIEGFNSRTEREVMDVRGGSAYKEEVMDTRGDSACKEDVVEACESAPECWQARLEASQKARRRAEESVVELEKEKAELQESVRSLQCALEEVSQRHVSLAEQFQVTQAERNTFHAARTGCEQERNHLRHCLAQLLERRAQAAEQETVKLQHIIEKGNEAAQYLEMCLRERECQVERLTAQVRNLSSDQAQKEQRHGRSDSPAVWWSNRRNRSAGTRRALPAVKGNTTYPASPTVVEEYSPRTTPPPDPAGFRSSVLDDRTPERPKTGTARLRECAEPRGPQRLDSRPRGTQTMSSVSPTKTRDKGEHPRSKSSYEQDQGSVLLPSRKQEQQPCDYGNHRHQHRTSGKLTTESHVLFKDSSPRSMAASHPCAEDSRASRGLQTLVCCLVSREPHRSYDANMDVDASQKPLIKSVLGGTNTAALKDIHHRVLNLCHDFTAPMSVQSEIETFDFSSRGEIESCSVPPQFPSSSLSSTSSSSKSRGSLHSGGDGGVHRVCSLHEDAMLHNTTRAIDEAPSDISSSIFPAHDLIPPRNGPGRRHEDVMCSHRFGDGTLVDVKDGISIPRKSVYPVGVPPPMRDKDCHTEEGLRSRTFSLTSRSSFQRIARKGHPVGDWVVMGSLELRTRHTGDLHRAPTRLNGKSMPFEPQSGNQQEAVFCERVEGGLSTRSDECVVGASVSSSPAPRMDFSNP